MNAIAEGLLRPKTQPASTSETRHVKSPQNQNEARPTREEAEAAVRTLIEWAGDDPTREGLLETPKRVVKSYEEFYSGYHENPAEILAKTFKEVENYSDMVLLRDIELQSHCEHHMVPITGRAHIAYVPDGKVIGISKLARVIDVFAHRLQTQETMTVQIVKAINETLKPKGVALIIEAEHQCMSSRGVKKSGVDTITSQFTGVFEDPLMEQRFMQRIGRA